jgi:NAD(P)H-dependent FMN reductase
LNRKLLGIAAELCRGAGADVNLVEFRELMMPLYDGDLEASAGIPDGARLLREHLLAADAFVFASPEYNSSIPGTVKNAIDWVSRYRPFPFKNKHGLLLSASPGLVGGNRGLWALRVPLELLGAHVYPDMFSLSRAAEAFEGELTLKDASLQARLDGLIRDFMAHVQRNVPADIAAAQNLP